MDNYILGWDWLSLDPTDWAESEILILCQFVCLFVDLSQIWTHNRGLTLFLQKLVLGNNEFYIHSDFVICPWVFVSCLV